uniref:Immunoglobulin V-set domain-containing protein n=1 Tax=Seriola lalandi dorsalis TaxID=1841481 RepID=A0A3B4XNR8_SERLL
NEDHLCLLITLADSGNRVFTVTFHQLQLSDSGKYWCGVDRPGFDTYTEVILTVKEGKCMMFVTITLNKIYLYTLFNFFLCVPPSVVKCNPIN